MHDEGDCSADSRSVLMPLPMCLALGFVEHVEHCVDVEGAVRGRICFVCHEPVDVDDTERVPFAKTGVCGLCQTSLFEERTAEDLRGFKCLNSNGVKVSRLFLLLLEGIRESDHWSQLLAVSADRCCFVHEFLEQDVDDVQLYHGADAAVLK